MLTPTFAKSYWEVADLEVGDFLNRAVAADFEVVEIYLPWLEPELSRLSELLQERSLRLVAHISTEGENLDGHLRYFDRWFDRAVSLDPIHINVHSGSDLFSVGDNARIVNRVVQAAAAFNGVGVTQETHRGRAFYSLPQTWGLMERCPDVRLTLDISHWFCVHESALSGHEAELQEVIDRSDHAHLRVGFDEGPQVSDPRIDFWKPWLDRHLEIWKRLLASARSRGTKQLVFTPEHGPVPYMPVHGSNATPVADAWEVNVWLRDHVSELL